MEGATCWMASKGTCACLSRAQTRECAAPHRLPQRANHRRSAPDWRYPAHVPVGCAEFAVLRSNGQYPLRIPAFRFAGVSQNSSFPWCSNATRLQRSASSRYAVEVRIATPSAAVHKESSRNRAATRDRRRWSARPAESPLDDESGHTPNELLLMPPRACRKALAEFAHSCSLQQLI